MIRVNTTIDLECKLLLPDIM